MLQSGSDQTVETDMGEYSRYISIRMKRPAVTTSKNTESVFRNYDNNLDLGF